MMRFKRGNLYSIWWEDSYTTTTGDHKAGDPVIQITHGTYIKRSKKMIVLYTTHTKDWKSEWAKDETGIMANTITRVKEWGKCLE